MSPVEMVAAVATLINVYLTAKNNIWCWPWGIVSVVLYGFVFYESRLFSSMGLQAFYYLPMQFYGWWVWLRCGPKRDDDLPITKLSFRVLLFWFGINLPLAALLGFLMTYTGAQLTYTDALVTAMSVTAQYLLTHKYIENWVLWILVDIVYAFYLLPKQGLYISAVLYLILLLLAVWGLIAWVRIMRKESARTDKTLIYG
jgi:nicotinamide mononucleotide transporter